MRKTILQFSKHFSILPILLLAAFAGFAQKAITGKITDKDGVGIPNVTIYVMGTKVATQTEADGTFTINAPANAASLVVSSVGYDPQQVAISGRTQIDLSLAQSNSRLNEVVVIGYGTTRKKDLTGAVSTVNSKDFQKGNITTPEQLIAGKIAGVSVISNGGQPGQGSTIRIRGGSSLRASNDPLFVIDGVPLDNGSISGASNPLSLINSNDIESFTILKDASAAAIYGTRASNGVIIITTKKGTGGKLKANFSSVNSLSKIIDQVDVLSADEFRTVVNAKGNAAQKAMLGNANTNWQNEIYQTAFASNNNISLSGGIKKLPYRVSLGYLNQDGILRTDHLQRTSLAIAINPVLFDNHLKVDINLKGSSEDVRFANQGAIGSAVSFNPTLPVFDDKSNRFGGYYEYLDPATATGLRALAGRNPLGLLKQRFDKGKPQRSIGNIQLDYKFHFLPDLHANLNLGYDVSKGTGTVYVSDSAASDYIAGGKGGQNNYYKQTKQNTLLEFYLSYAKDISSIKSRFDILAGYAYNNYQTKNFSYASYYANGTKVPNSDPNFLFNIPENTLLSYFGRANFTFHDRYLLTGTLRRDGSSRFGPDNKWGTFPSIALAWKAKEESFLKNSKVLSDLKVRIGYGITGQQDGIGLYDFLSFYGLSNGTATYQFGNTFYQMYRPSGFNPAIKWEETATTNVALDYGFLDNRITGSIDVYYKKTSDLLNEVPQPAGANFSAYQTVNVGDMTNKGIEFNINAQPVRNSNFTWDVNFNTTYNKNEITNLTIVPKDKNYPGFPSGGIAGGIGGQFSQINAVGYPKNTFNLYKQVYDADGKPVEGVFVDKNGDGIINQDDLYKSKKASPDVFFGFSTGVTYKKWNAGFVLRASVNNYVYNNTYSANGILSQITGNPVLYNVSSNYLETNFRGNSLELLSDYYIQNASFLKMDNLNVGYNAGKFYHNKVALRINATVQNVFVITKYKGLDPEINSGVDNNFYPRPRIFALGVNLDF